MKQQKDINQIQNRAEEYRGQKIRIRKIPGLGLVLGLHSEKSAHYLRSLSIDQLSAIDGLNK